MKIIYKKVPILTIEDFADKHGLTMVVDERKKPVGDPDRYWAEFDHSEVGDGCILIGTYGNGATPEEAIDDYAGKIELKRLVINAFGENRTEIDVPRLIHKVKEGA
ncbi:MAG: hypothetical protein ABFD82_17985 [Syntrophaceae bacterium]